MVVVVVPLNIQSGPDMSSEHFHLEMCFAPQRHALCFCHISTSKTAPELRCFAQFDLETCFAPQHDTLFRHPHLQKWSEHFVF